ncbi:MAG: hypothetical protein C4562_04520 [Actinobacteria bacterium]|nr:MAG: hypothetical protein C4562_04520 [Actinomycetota bacterium]
MHLSKKSLIVVLVVIVIILCTFITALSGQSKSTKAKVKRIAYVKNNNIWLMKASGASKQKLTSFSEGTNKISNLAFCPNGRKIAFVYTDQSDSLRIYNLNTGQTSSNLAGSLSSVDCLTWRSNTKLIFDGLGNSSLIKKTNANIYQLDLTNNSVSQLINEHGLEPRVSPDKKRLAYVSIKLKNNNPNNYLGYESLKYLNFKNHKTKTVRRSVIEITLDGRAFNNPRWSPNSKKIVTHSTGSDVSGGINTYALSGKKLGGFFTSQKNGYLAYGFAEFLDNNRLVYKCCNAAYATKYYLRMSKINGTKTKTIKRDKFSVWRAGDLSVSISKQTLLFATYNLATSKPRNIYSYGFKSKKIKKLVSGADLPVWQP